MPKSGKKYKASLEKVDRTIEYKVGDAVSKLKEISYTKFDPTVEVVIRLGVDPRKADQLVRGTVALPAGTGKTVRVLVLCRENKEEQAKAAGADYVGLAEYIEKIQGGWAGIDVIVATPDVMVEVGKIGKILGPKKLMPNPKSGTVTNDVGKAVQELKGGKIEYRVDKAGVLHVGVGKLSFDADKITQNVKALLGAVMRSKPSSAKGQYVKSIFMSTTMSPSVKIARDEMVTL